MSMIELEAQKASLAREILCLDDENIINKMLLILQTASQPQKKQKRKIGFLKGQAKVIFHNDWEMTPEELGMI